MSFFIFNLKALPLWSHQPSTAACLPSSVVDTYSVSTTHRAVASSHSMNSSAFVSSDLKRFLYLNETF
jgi:hypothetical protein